MLPGPPTSTLFPYTTLFRSRQIASRGQHGLAHLHGTLAHRLLLDDDAALPLDRTRDARAHGERRVRGVDDRVDRPVRDVAALDRDRGVADLELHGSARRRSCALTLSHDRSSSSCGRAPTDLPCALRSASTSAKRRRNFSIASCRASSASIEESRATFTRENRSEERREGKG